MLTIFYDGKCPLCCAEMRSLKNHDKGGKLILVDLHTAGFDTLYPEINIDHAMKILHGTYQDERLLGLAVTHRAWTLVGKGFWVAPLSWPVFKTVCHWFYLGLAKYRHPISATFAKLFNVKTTQCNKGTCFEKSTNTDHRRQ